MRRKIIILIIVVLIAILICAIVFFLLVGDIAYPVIYAHDDANVCFYTDVTSAKSFKKSTKIRRRLNMSIVLILSDFEIVYGRLENRPDLTKYPVIVCAKSKAYSLQYTSLRTGMTFHLRTHKENVIKNYDDMIKDRIGTNFRWGVHPFDNISNTFLEYMIFDYKCAVPFSSYNSINHLKLKDESEQVLKKSNIPIANE
jgi:hypothetical protein